MDDDAGAGWHVVPMSDEVEEAAPPAFSDDALASAFSAEHGGRLLHVAAWGGNGFSGTESDGRATKRWRCRTSRGESVGRNP